MKIPVKILGNTVFSDPNYWAEKYRAAREGRARMEACAKTVREIRGQCRIMECHAGANIVPIVAALVEADPDCADLLLKPLDKACRKARARLGRMEENYGKMVRAQERG